MKFMDDATTTTHCFEAAGLGKAPFKFIGKAERLFQPAPGEPVKPGGTCAYCSTGIRYAYQICSSDSKVFDVGCDCLQRTDPVIWEQVKAARAEERREARRNANSAAYEAREVERIAHGALMDATEAEWKEGHATEAAWMDSLATTDNPWLRRAAERARGHVRSTGELSQSQHDALRRAAIEVQCTGLFGTVGKREKNLTGIYLGHIVIDGYNPGTTAALVRLAIQRDDGTWALLMWKASSYILQDRPDGKYTDIADVIDVKITATVKSHGEYKGVDQTWVTRAKVVDY